MRIVIAGAGAIGGYIGARLARAGAEVVLFARGPHLLAMQARGLKVISPDGDFEVKPNVSGDPHAIGQADVVVLGVMAHSLTALAQQLHPLLGPDTVVVSTQNGIPWWYFQNHGGELDGMRLERVDPGGVIAGVIGRAASSDRQPISQGMSSSLVSSVTPRATRSAWASRTAPGPSEREESRSRSSRPAFGARSGSGSVTRSG